MATLLDPWHHPRPALATAYLDAFDVGLNSARGIFAKRRMGKSEFLEQDLIPAAQHAGYLTAYANLWAARDNPALALLEAIAHAVEPKGPGKVFENLRRPVKKVKATGKVAGAAEAGLEAEFGEVQRQHGPALTMLMREFDKRKKKLLLVIDEAQVLAAAEHSNFTHALRAALDSRKAAIKVVFAGSSENTLRRMFARPSEPFYNWAPLEPFDLLGEEFVRAMVAKVNALTKFPLAASEALAAYANLHRTPEFFRRYLMRYLTHAQLGSQAALEATSLQVFNEANFALWWAGLLPADREVVKLLAAGISDLHGKHARERLGRALGVGKAVPLSTPQHSLRRLQADATVTRLDHGLYRFEDDVLAEWIRRRSDDEDEDGS